MWNPDAFLQREYEQSARELAFQARDRAEWEAWRQRLRSVFAEKLGGFRVTSDSVAPAVMLEEVEGPDHIRRRVELTTAEGLVFPAYVLVPKGSAPDRGRPAVVACHGHGYGSRDTVGLEADGTPRQKTTYHKDFALALARKGFCVIVPELYGFGDMRLAEDAEKPPRENSCYRIATNLLMSGKTLAGVRASQVFRAVDFLTAQSEIDCARIGIMGISGGGLAAGFAAALDERIRAVVISGYVNTFRDSIMSIRHCVDNFIPGILQYAEMPDLLALIAPRPLFVESGEDDHIFPIAATQEAIAQLERVYSLLGVPDRLDRDLFAGGHEISGAKSYDWLSDWLSPERMGGA